MTNLGRNASGFFTTLEQSTITVKVVKGFDKDGNPEEWIATVYPLAYLVEAVFFVGLCMLGLAIIMASYCSGFAFNLTEVSANYNAWYHRATNKIMSSSSGGDWAYWIAIGK